MGISLFENVFHSGVFCEYAGDEALVAVFFGDPFQDTQEIPANPHSLKIFSYDKSSLRSIIFGLCIGTDGHDLLCNLLWSPVQ